MKRIRVGIITQLSLNTVNYGNHLQAYALNKYLNSHFLNIEAETMLIKGDAGIKFTTLKGMFSHYILKAKIRVYGLLYNTAKIESRYNRFRSFAKSNIVLSKENITYPEIRESDYDIFIVGSDVVWYQTPGKIDRIRFLDINKNFIKKYAYSASFGNAYLPKENKRLIADYLRKFDGISVRESSAITLLNSIQINNVFHTCDPTLLLTDNEWKKISKKPKLIEDKGIADYVFAYFLGNTREQINRLKNVCNREKIQLLFIPYINGYKKDDVEKEEEYGLIDCSPQEWIWLVDHAKYVITDSFHGLVFSIIFKTRFICVKRVFKEDINSRIVDLLRLIGAEDKLMNINEIYNLKKFSWDFELYLKQIDFLVANSKKYLQNIVGEKI